MKIVSYALVEKKLLAFLEEHFGAEKAGRIADVILFAERHGIEGQGLAKLSGTEPLQSIKPKGDIIVSPKSDVSCHINANAQPSFYVAQTATDHALAIAEAKGISIVGVNGIYSSVGSLAYYAERISSKDLVGVVMAQCPPSMAPYGVKPPLFGTNPLAASFPTLEEPITFDMATSAMTWYGLVLAKMRGQSIPEGLAIDSNGVLTTDPKTAMDGALLPFADTAKASNIAIMVEVMAGALVGAQSCNTSYTGDWGMFILAINPSLLGDTELFKSECSRIVKIMKEAPTIEDKEIRLPSDRARAHAQKVMETDTLSLDESIAAVLGL